MSTARRAGRKAARSATTITEGKKARSSATSWSGLRRTRISKARTFFSAGTLFHVAGQILLLGLCFVVLAMLSDGLWVALASGLRQWIGRHPGYMVLQQRFAGGVYLALGTATAVSGSGD